MLTTENSMNGALSLLLGGTLLAGCVSTQLNENTLDLASTVAYLHRSQVIDNLGRFIDSGDAIPAQVALTGGIVQVNNEIKPNWIHPYSFLKTGLNPMNSTAKKFELGFVDTWTENWNLAPVADAEDLKRLRALYRYAVYDRRSPLPAVSAEISTVLAKVEAILPDVHPISTDVC